MSWADLEGFVDNLPGRSAFRRLVDPLGMYTDPEMERLVGIEDWLEIIHWRMVGAPAEHVPLGVVGAARKVAAVTSPPRPQPANVIDIRAEYARRENEAAPTKTERSPNLRSKQIREELALRYAAASTNS